MNRVGIKPSWPLLQAALLVLVLAVACAPTTTEEMGEATPQELQPITFQAAFLAQGNISFTAPYVAKEEGYFAEQGLDVTIEHSSPGGGEQLQRLAAKDIEFTTNTGANFAKLIHDSNPPFVAVAVLGQEGDHAILVLEDSPVEEIGDLEGLRVGYKTGEAIEPPWMLAMLTQAGLTLGDVELVTVGFDPRVVLPDFGEGRVDGVQVFKSNEPDTLRRAGYEVRLFAPEDYGIHFLGQLFTTHQDFVRDDPEMVRKFVRANMKAMEFIMDPANKDRVTDIVMIYAGEDADRAHNEFIWTTEVQYVTSAATEQVGFGYVTDQQWQDMMDVMVEFGSLDEAVPVDRLWDPQFVESVYDDNGSVIWP